MTAQRPQTRNRYFTITLATMIAALVIFAGVSACTSKQAKAKPNIVTKDAPPKPGVVAKIGGEEITEEQLIGDDKMDFFELEKRAYDLKMDRLNKLMVDKLIGAEAKKAGMSTDDYVNKKVVGGDTKVSDKEYKKFVEEKRIPESQINPQIKERIINYIQSTKKQEAVQNYISKLTKSNPVEVYFKKPKMEVNVDPGNAPVAGGKDAKVTIVEFSDFQCPFCGRVIPTVHELQKKYGSKIKLAFRQFPLPMHRDAVPAAEAALCVRDQGGDDKFWKYHDVLFKNQDKLDTASLEKYAKDVGVDSGKWKTCFDGKKFSDAVKKDQEYGEKIGVKSTPTFFINGQIVSGAVDQSVFAEIIDDELTAKK